LLDISNNDEYIWTTSFSPAPPIITYNNIGVVIGVVVGSTFCAVLLLVGGYYLRKWYKNKQNIQEQTNAISTPGEEQSREILRIPDEKSIRYQNQQPFQILPISGNTSNSLQNNKMIQEIRGGEDHPQENLLLQIPEENDTQRATPTSQILPISGNSTSNLLQNNEMVQEKK
jgi:hypothetical protein